MGKLTIIQKITFDLRGPHVTFDLGRKLHLKVREGRRRGLVVKTSDFGTEGPGFDSRLLLLKLVVLLPL